VNDVRPLVAALCDRLETGGFGAAAVTSMLDVIWLVNSGFINFDTVSLGEETRPAADLPEVTGKEPAPPAAATDLASGAAPAIMAALPAEITVSPVADPDEMPVVPDTAERTIEPLMYVAVRSGTGKALPARRAVLLAAPPPLGRTLELERAFSVLRTTRATQSSGYELDVDQTIRHFASTRHIAPRWRARRGRWLRLLVIIERSPTMRFWQASARGLMPVASRGTGALSTDVLYLERGVSPAGRGSPRLVDRTGRLRHFNAGAGEMLVLYLTDTLGPGWLTGQIPDLLGRWSSRAAITVLHVLPRGFWSRTSMSSVLPLTSWKPPATVRGTAHPQFPLICYLGPQSIRTTMAALTGHPRGNAMQLYSREAEETGYSESVADKFASIDAEEFDRLATLAVAQPDEPEIEALWEEFCSAATPATLRLASFFAPAPLVMPIMRMIERALVPEAAPWQIAELVMSGLIRRWRDCQEHDVSRMEYEFLPGIRERLLQLSTQTQQWDVIDLISNYVERRFGRAREFEAYCSGEFDALAGTIEDREFAPFSRVGAWFGALQPNTKTSGPPEAVPAGVGPIAFTGVDKPVEVSSSIAADLPSVPEIVSSAVMAANQVLQRNDLVITSRIDQRIDHSPVAKGRVLIEILSDLVVHAASYTREGNISISAELERLGETHQDISMSVRDTGGANPAIIRSRLLGTSVKASPHRSEIEKMGGSMGVRGDANAGTTTVWIRLPVFKTAPRDSHENYTTPGLREAAAESTIPDSGAYARSEARSSPHRHKTIRVLLAYHDPLQRDELGRLLWSLRVEYESVIARNSALVEADVGKFDMVIAPGSLSKLDLSALIRGRRATEVRFRERRVPIIVVLDSVNHEHRREWLFQGADDCVYLPISSTTVKRLLARWVPRFDDLEDFSDPEQEETVLILGSNPAKARKIIETMWSLGLVPKLQRDLDIEQIRQSSFALIVVDLDDGEVQTQKRVGEVRFVEERDQLARAMVIAFTSDLASLQAFGASGSLPSHLSSLGIDEHLVSNASRETIGRKIFEWLSSEGKDISRHYTALSGELTRRVVAKAIYLVAPSGNLGPRRRILESLGLTVEMTRSGADAQMMAKFERPDLILVDCRADGIGMRTIGSLQNNPPSRTHRPLIVAIVDKSTKNRISQRENPQLSIVHSLKALRPLIARLRSNSSAILRSIFASKRTIDLQIAGELMHRPTLSAREKVEHIIFDLNKTMTRIRAAVAQRSSTDHDACSAELKQFCVHLGADRLAGLNTKLATALSREDVVWSTHVLRCMETEAEAVCEALWSFVE
jgi:CheY-like chemotaxis protein